MFNKIKEYLKYRKNKKIAKMEIVKIGATTLPLLREISDKKVEIINFVLNLVNSTKDMNGEKLVETVLNTVSDSLQTSNERIIEIFTYIANLEPKDIQKILMNSIAETNNNMKK